jgi:hypothetical protein
MLHIHLLLRVKFKYISYTCIHVCVRAVLYLLQDG